MTTADQATASTVEELRRDHRAGVSHDAPCLHAGRGAGRRPRPATAEPAAAVPVRRPLLLGQSAAGRIVTFQLANRSSMCRARMHTAPPRYAISARAVTLPPLTPGPPASTRHSRSPTPRAALPAPGQPPAGTALLHSPSRSSPCEARGGQLLAIQVAARTLTPVRAGSGRGRGVGGAARRTRPPAPTLRHRPQSACAPGSELPGRGGGPHHSDDHAPDVASRGCCGEGGCEAVRPRGPSPPSPWLLPPPPWRAPRTPRTAPPSPFRSASRRAWGAGCARGGPSRSGRGTWAAGRGRGRRSRITHRPRPETSTAPRLPLPTRGWRRGGRRAVFRHRATGTYARYDDDGGRT